MWIVYMTWDEDSAKNPRTDVDDLPVNTIYIAESEEDAKEHLRQFMSPVWDDWCFGHICYHPEYS